MPDFTTLIPSAQSFYTQLAANNTKAWWDAHRGTYDDTLKVQALALLDALAAPLSALTNTPVKTKLFRPHRDVRFSKDKTPYKTHLHMLWQLETDARQNPVFFFGIGTDYVSIGAGLMGLDKPVLDDWRKFVDLDTKRIMGIMDGVQRHGFTLREPALKRVPTGTPADHPAADLLRMKGVVASKPLTTRDTLTADIEHGFKQVWPLNALLLQIAEA